MSDELNEKQRLFVAEYLVDRNGKQAAIRAGYSPTSAEVQASRLLSNDKVRSEIDRKLRVITSKIDLTAEYVLGNLKEVTERCLQHKPVMVFDKEAKAYVQAKDEDTGEGIWEFDSAGANKALELLGKHLKLFTDKVELDVSDSLADVLKNARERANGKK